MRGRTMGGYVGKILRINLTERKIETEALNMEFAQKYIGGRGLAGKMFIEEVPANVDALSPENKVFIATGALTGTNAPTSGRFMVITKSPLDGTLASSNSGGFWGPQLKFAGYDLVILEGKADSPVCISIRDDQVEIKDAGHVWGKSVYETTSILKEEFGDDQAKVLTIGPAGENLSLMAFIMNDLNRASGRSGIGAVMGSKNVKAIIVRGTGKVVNANPDTMKEVLTRALPKIRKNSVSNGETDQSSGEILTEKYLTKKGPCYRCPIACGRYSQGSDGTKSEDKTVRVFVSNCGIQDYDVIDQVINLCDNYGLDTITVGKTIATAMELLKRGFIKLDDLEGTPLAFGNGNGLVEWVRKIAYGEGLGAKMALGAKYLADSVGAEGISTTVKKKKEDSKLTTVIDSVGMCLFSSQTLELSDYTELVNAVTGFDYTDEELLACGERIINNEREYNLRVE